MQRSTIYEVASRSGVSTATVSRVIHNANGYSAATRDRVLASAAELGWVPSGSARSLAKRKTGIIGVLFSDLDAGSAAEEEAPLYVDQVIRGAERAATQAGHAVLIAATRGTEGHDLALSVAGRVDGLVVVAHSLSEDDIAELGQRIPLVVLSDRAGRRTNVDSVGVDNHAGMQALVTHLVSHHGLHDIACVGGPYHSPDARERFAGFRAAMRAAGLPCHPKPDASGGFTVAGGAQAVHDLVTRRGVPQAIVCCNDQMAIGALDVLDELGLRVPQDVAVTGFDDVALAKRVRPPLTTIAQPMREIGAEAIRMVLARVADPGAQRRAAVLPIDLVVRRSCGCRASRSTSRRTA